MNAKKIGAGIAPTGEVARVHGVFSEIPAADRPFYEGVWALIGHVGMAYKPTCGTDPKLRTMESGATAFMVANCISDLRAWTSLPKERLLDAIDDASDWFKQHGMSHHLSKPIREHLQDLRQYARVYVDLNQQISQAAAAKGK